MKSFYDFNNFNSINILNKIRSFNLKIKSFVKNIFKRKKVINCKYCNEKLRIPYLKGKTLRVICPHCGNKFEVIIH